MRSCLKLAFTGFILGATMFFGVLLFPWGWINAKDDNDLAGWLFLIGVVVGIASLFTVLNSVFN